MNWVKKGIWGSVTMLFLFIFLIILEPMGANPFSETFLTIGGLMLILIMGFIETNLVTL